ncbi:hypothetical protein [Paraburkholderia unamae]|uniref:hypothetical protein n=1 Tax=Paraburkholderia unamae TaxID=219649 RepID=UPI00105821F7|nr:hypothetical protein [Paraburkholderia unamae]
MVLTLVLACKAGRNRCDTKLGDAPKATPQAEWTVVNGATEARPPLDARHQSGAAAIDSVFNEMGAIDDQGQKPWIDLIEKAPRPSGPSEAIGWPTAEVFGMELARSRILPR